MQMKSALGLPCRRPEGLRHVHLKFALIIEEHAADDGPTAAAGLRHLDLHVTPQRPRPILAASKG